MGFYASGFGSLDPRAEAAPEQVESAVDGLDRDAWTVHDLTDRLSLTFGAKYRDAEVASELTPLAGLVAVGGYIQFTGENDSVWRLVFTEDGLARQDMRWTAPVLVATAAAAEGDR